MKKVNIKGVIVSDNDKWVYDWFGIASTSPNSVAKEIEDAQGQAIEVEINSGGGDVFSGSEIYTKIKAYQGQVTVKIVGLAASAASVIAMAGDRVLMSPTAQMMIHNVSSSSSGDYRDMQHTAEVLKNANDTIANAYILKTNKPREELLAMMDSETWLTPNKALEQGFIDEIMFSDNLQLAANYGSGLLPTEVINKIRSQYSEQKNSEFLLLKNKLKLLKLKGDKE